MQSFTVWKELRCNIWKAREMNVSLRDRKGVFLFLCPCVTPVTGKGPTSTTHEGIIPCNSNGGEICCWAWVRIDLNHKLDRDASTVRNRKLPRRHTVWKALSEERWKTCPDFVQKERNKEMRTYLFYFATKRIIL